MCDSILALPITSSIKFRRLGFINFESYSSLSSNSLSSDYSGVKNGCLLFPQKTKIAESLVVFESKGNQFSRELGFKEKEDTLFNFEPDYAAPNQEDIDENLSKRNEDGFGEEKIRDARDDNAAASSRLNSINSMNHEDGKKRSENREIKSEQEEEENMLPLEDKDIEMEKQSGVDSRIVRLGKRRQVMRRSNMLAKQVISIRNALNLGFISQLWIDTATWMVVIVEVKPNLLSGESEWFLLDDVNQVGDVVLVEDETVMENELKMVGLETLVGYRVVTPGRQNIGKIRGYTFNINSGAVESLELDSFGYSFLPSSLVSTYALLVEDVLEVISDVVVVHEDAASRIQRLTKGLLGTQTVGNSSLEELELEHYEFERSKSRFDHGGRDNKRRHKNRKPDHDFDLPLDYI